jgi:Uma2 family endonuclease
MSEAREIEYVSYAQYCALERTTGIKHEWHDGVVRAMAGGTAEHARLQAQLTIALGRVLRGKSCQPYSSDLRVHITSEKRTVYPDVTVVCDRPAFSDIDPNAITNPTVVIEVLSASSEGEDRGEKWAAYQQLPSLLHYVLVSQVEPRVEVFTRTELGWHYAAVEANSVDLSRLGVSIPIDEIYARVA